MILSIETSTISCSVSLHNQGDLVASGFYLISKSHSALLPGIIDELLQNAGIEKGDLEAIAVSSGPGSYTGLRIGTSCAKALCFGLSIPLISITSLDVLAFHGCNMVFESHYIVPMIDARRMEVYTQVCAENGSRLEEMTAKILEPDSLMHLNDKPILILGDAVEKCKDFFINSESIKFKKCHPDSADMGVLANEKFRNAEFENIAYFEPIYLKAFQTKKPKDRLAI